MTNFHRTPVKLPVPFVAHYRIGAHMAEMYYEMMIGIPAPVQLP